jgi:hypothetical protein
MEESALSEWPERMDIAGSNHWLPAYGFQQPTLIHQQNREADLAVNGTFRLSQVQLHCRLTSAVLACTLAGFRFFTYL